MYFLRTHPAVSQVGLLCLDLMPGFLWGPQNFGFSQGNPKEASLRHSGTCGDYARHQKDRDTENNGAKEEVLQDFKDCPAAGLFVETDVRACTPRVFRYSVACPREREVKEEK